MIRLDGKENMIRYKKTLAIRCFNLDKKKALKSIKRFFALDSEYNPLRVEIDFYLISEIRNRKTS